MSGMVSDLVGVTYGKCKIPYHTQYNAHWFIVLKTQKSVRHWALNALWARSIVLHWALNALKLLSIVLHWALNACLITVKTGTKRAQNRSQFLHKVSESLLNSLAKPNTPVSYPTVPNRAIYATHNTMRTNLLYLKHHKMGGIEHWMLKKFWAL